MKKLKLTVTLLCALFFSGCQEENIIPNNPHKEAVTYYPPSNPTNPPVLQPKISISTYGLKAISLNKLDSLNKITSYPLATNTVALPSNLNEPQEIKSPFNNAQIAIAQPFINNILKLESTDKIRVEVKSFEEKVNYANLTKNEKIMLLALSSNVVTALDFIDSGKAAKIQQQVYQQLGYSSSATRMSGNCINTKSILRGAVVAGMGSAVAGAYAGATGGTVALPGIGTVTGGVAGGVFGFAGGFTSGILYGVATDFIFNCMGRTEKVVVYDCSRYGSMDACRKARLDAIRSGQLILKPDFATGTWEWGIN